MSSMLEQAIIDAKDLREAAHKKAEETIVEKYQVEIKEAIDRILEQEEDPAAMDPGMGDMDMGMDVGMGDMGADMGADMGGMETQSVTPESAKQPEPGEDQVDNILDQLPFVQTTADNRFVELNLDKLEESLNLKLEEILEEDEIELEEDLESLLDEMDPLPFPRSEFDPPSPARSELEEADLECEIDGDPLSNDRTKAMFGEEIDLDEDLLEALFEEDDDELLDEEFDLDESKLEAEAPPNDKVTPADFENLKKGTRYTESLQIKKQNKKLINEQKMFIKEQQRTSTKLAKLEEKLDKYTTVITKFKLRLDESNLTNAKLLYQNRVLDSVSLNERQKDKIVETIQNANSVKEAKIIFETLLNTVGVISEKHKKTPQTLREVVSDSSSAFMPRKEEKKTDSFSERMKALAGLK